MVAWGGEGYPGQDGRVARDLVERSLAGVHALHLVEKAGDRRALKRLQREAVAGRAVAGRAVQRPRPVNQRRRQRAVFGRLGRGESVREDQKARLAELLALGRRQGAASSAASVTAGGRGVTSDEHRGADLTEAGVVGRHLGDLLAAGVAALHWWVPSRLPVSL